MLCSAIVSLIYFPEKRVQKKSRSQQHILTTNNLRMGGKNRAVALKKGSKTKKSLLNPLIKELYRITGKLIYIILLLVIIAIS